MKVALRIVLGFIVLLLVLAATAFLARTWIAERVLTGVLERQGIENVELTVNAVGLSGITVSNLSSGTAGRDEKLTITQVKADWTLGGLRQGFVDHLEITDVTGIIERTDSGFFVAGMPITPGGSDSVGGQSRFRLGSLTLSNARITIRSEFGSAYTEIEGAYDRIEGGTARLDLNAPEFGWAGTKFTDTTAAITTTVDPDMSFSGVIAVTANLTAADTLYPDINVTADINGANIAALINDRDNAEAEMQFAVSAPALPLDILDPGSEFITFLAGNAPGQAELAASGRAYYKNGVAILENPATEYLTLTTDTGIKISLSAPEGTRLAEWSKITKFIDVNYDVSGLKASPAGGSVTLVRSETDPWTIDSSFAAAAWDDEKFSLVPGRITYSGTIDGARLNGDTLFSGGATRLETNNLSLSNLLLDGEFSIDADLNARQVLVTVPKGCLTVERPRANTRNGIFSLRNASFCPPASGPIVLQVSQDESGGISLDADGVLSAQGISAQVGATRLSGLPPAAMANLQIRDRVVTVEAAFKGGNINLNDRVGMSGMIATGQATYSEGAIMLDGDVASLTIRDLAEDVVFTPLMFFGDLTIRDAAANFMGGLKTFSGVAFSDIDGTYDLKAGDGLATMTFDQSNQRRLPLQPAEIIPSLKGFVENASGTIAGQVDILFDNNKVSTKADFSLEDFTFNGPTRAVTITSGMNLSAEFSSIAPLMSDGLQSATIDLIDLDALKLERGEVLFEAPGDRTLRIRSASWPWFGGNLTISNGTIPLSGRNITVPLEVRDIDMKELFDFLDIDGLSGEGKLEGTLPILIENGEARIDGGVLRASAPGRLQYKNQAVVNAANASGEAGKLAFDALSSFDFTKLELDVNGSLSGEIQIGARMEGNSDAVVTSAGINYNIRINAPVLGLRRQYQAQQETKSQILDEFSREFGVELEFGEAESAKKDDE